MGYEPDGPRQETVYPGQQTSPSSIKILIRAPAQQGDVQDLFDKGVEDYRKGLTSRITEGRRVIRAGL